MRKILLITILGLAAVGCRGSSNATPDGPPGTHDTGGGGIDANLGMVTTVKNIRMNQPTNGTIVTLQNVVVVGRVASSTTGKMWVQDQGGGQYSGIEIYCKYGGTNPSCQTTEATFKSYAAKHVLTITGKFSSFAYSDPANSQPTLEIESPTITDTGMMMDPVAVDVTAATIAKDQYAAGGGAEPYKGVYVHVSDAPTVTVTSVSPAEETTTCPGMVGSGSASGTTFDGFEANANGATLEVGLTFYNSVDYCIPCTDTGTTGFMPNFACPETGMYMTTEVTTATTFKGISGVVETGSNKTSETVYLQISPTYDGDIPTM